MSVKLWKRSGRGRWELKERNEIRKQNTRCETDRQTDRQSTRHGVGHSITQMPSYLWTQARAQNQTHCHWGGRAEGGLRSAFGSSSSIGLGVAWGLQGGERQTRVHWPPKLRRISCHPLTKSFTLRGCVMKTQSAFTSTLLFTKKCAMTEQFTYTEI